jgi:multidrug efflux pump subunit AcrA (membrane-fusion protein)
MLVLGGLATGGYYLWKTQFSFGPSSEPILLHEVVRDDFRLSITERGEIEATGVTEIKSEVKAVNNAGVTILRIVPEGTMVEPGDFLVELDSSALETERTNQQIVVNTAEAAVIEARNLYETAEIALREYREGTYVQERQTIESEVFVAEENLNRAREYYEYSKKLAAKGYVNQLQLEADKFAVEKSTKELAAAKTKLTVIDEFTRTKMVKQLESDILIAKAKWESMKNSYDIELQKLRDVEDQISKCTILSPGAGVVVYAHVNDRGGEGFVIEEGAVVRERQSILRIPDNSKMQVELKVNESLVQYVAPGMTARIAPVGAEGLTLRGRVLNVNRFAEPTSWRKANVKDYKAYVEIADPNDLLRSGMTASVTIESQFVPDALQVPVQSVYTHGGKTYCFKKVADGWQAVPVVCGPTNDQFFVIESGLEENDKVAKDPKKFVDQVVLPKIERKPRTEVATAPPAEAPAG